MYFVRSLATLIVLSVACSVAGAAQPTQDWERFRARYPYHIQTIALAAPGEDGRRTLILSEPPPSVTLESLKSRYGDVIDELAVETQRVGFDGHVQDVVGVVDPARVGDVDALVARLARDFFGTLHKATVFEFDRVEPRTATSFDLSVSSGELREWLGLATKERSWLAGLLAVAASLLSVLALVNLLRRGSAGAVATLAICLGATWWAMRAGPSAPDTAVFRDLHADGRQLFKELLTNAREGVYLGEKPGLVVLVVRRSAPLNNSAGALREFALDSDLILGAVGIGDAVAVIGRERQAPLEALPPLRVETILQLAAATTTELGQSYERQRLFAGRYDLERHRDWAPIFLSDELHDTEYGSLLNITDQLLKSWSQHGEVEYINFGYPKPGAYPFKVALSQQVKASRITFNWNTKGVGYVDAADGIDTMAFTRTASLPVDYLGETDARLNEAEEKAYNYFSQRSDPNLVRVVQYASLYQIWRHFEVTARYTTPMRSHGGARAIRPLVEGFVQRFASNPFEDLDQVDDERLRAGLPAFRALQREVGRYLASDTGAVDRLVEALVNPRDAGPQMLLKPYEQAMELAGRIGGSPIVRFVVQEVSPLAMGLYASAEGAGASGVWIKTPSIVVSWPTGARAATVSGGHNLSSIVSRTIPDESVARGTVRVVEDAGGRTLRYNPADANGVGSGVRTLARSNKASTTEIESAIAARLRTAVHDARPLQRALALDAAAGARPLRGLNATKAQRLVNPEPWTSAGEIPASHATVLKRLDDVEVFSVVVERSEGQYLVSGAGNPKVITAGTSSSALDAVVTSMGRLGRNRPLHVHFRGVEPEQAKQFVRTIELHANDVKAARVRTSVETGRAGVDPVLLGELRRGRWRWDRTSVREATDTIETSGRHANFELEVPSAAGGASLKVRVKVGVERLRVATAEVKARIQQVIQRWIDNLRNLATEADLKLSIRQLMDDLREIDPLIANIEVRLAREADEITVVERQPMARHDAPAD